MLKMGRDFAFAHATRVPDGRIKSDWMCAENTNSVAVVLKNICPNADCLECAKDGGACALGRKWISMGCPKRGEAPERVKQPDDDRRSRQLRRYHQYKAEHRCVVCGHPMPPEYKYITCEVCKRRAKR